MEVPYETKLVDLGNKPDWLLEINPLGKVPVLRMGDKEYMPDSDEICAFLEKEYPDQALGTPEGAKEVGSKVFPAFAAFFKSKDPSDGTEQELLEQLRALNDYLQKSGPYVGGQTVCTVDMALAPKLHHMDLVLKEFKNWEVPEDMPAVKKYIALMRERPSFKATHYDNEIVYMGWKKKLDGGLGSSYERREHGSRRIIAGESSFAHARTIVDDQRLNVTGGGIFGHDG
eukprot:jgi/Pico_ML_1/51051/g2152.t1